MATATSTGSGAWSTDIWDGGAGADGIPADGDSVVIAAGHNVLMDADLSAWTGLVTVTITGGATPGMLYFKDGTNGYLKIRTGGDIVGTTDTNRGRLLANSDGSWSTTTGLAYANKAVIDLQGDAQIQATNLDIKLYCTEPTNKFVHVYGTKYTFSAETDVNTSTGVITLNTTAPAEGTDVVLVPAAGATLPTGLYADLVYYVRDNSGSTCKLATTNSDDTIVNITAVGSGTINVLTGPSSGGTALNVLEDVTGDSWSSTDGHDRVVLVDAGAPADYDQQRVTIASIDSASQITISAAIDSAQYAGCKLFLSSRNVSVRSAGTTSAQAIILHNSGDTHGGVYQCEIVNTGGSGTTFYGYGIYYGSGHTISGTISGCNRGIHYGSGHTISGTISGCSYGISYGSGHTISGTISGCTSSFRGPVGYITVKRGANVTYSFYDRNTVGQPFRIAAEDAGGITDAAKVYDNVGDVERIACDGATADYPDQDPDGGSGYAIMAANLQSNLSTIDPLYLISDRSPHRVWLTAGTWTITYKVYTTFTGDGGIADNGLTIAATYISAASPRTITRSTDSQAIATKTSDTDWTQTLAITITTAAAGWVDIDIYLTEYESGGEVFIWPVPTIAAS